MIKLLKDLGCLVFLKCLKDFFNRILLCNYIMSYKKEILNLRNDKVTVNAVLHSYLECLMLFNNTLKMER